MLCGDVGGDHVVVAGDWYGGDHDIVVAGGYRMGFWGKGLFLGMEEERRREGGEGGCVPDANRRMLGERGRRGRCGNRRGSAPEVRLTIDRFLLYCS